MASDSYNQGQTRTPFKRTASNHAEEQNLEFDFKTQEEPPPAAKPAAVSPQKTGATATASRLTPDFSSRPRAHEQNHRTETRADSQKSNLSTSSPSMSTTPNFNQFQQNIQRQSREQKALGSILSGVALSLIGFILLVALLAGFGGYVLYRQIQRQSVTVDQLETSLTKEIKNLNLGLRKTVDAVNMLDTRLVAQRQQIESLKNQLTELGNQTRKDRAAAQASLLNLQRRVVELERREAQR